MLIQLLVALPLAMISIFGISMFLNQSVKQTARMDQQMSLDLAHSQALHEVQGFEALKMNTSVGAFLLQTNVADCIQGKGTNCTQYATPIALTSLGSSASLSVSKNKKGAVCSVVLPGDCPFTQTATTQMQCDSKRCSALEIHLTTVDSSAVGTGTAKYRTRDSKVLLPTRSFASRDDIAFTCGPGQMVMGIDYDNSVARCGSIQGVTTTTSNYPARSLVNSQGSFDNVPATSYCAQGFAQSGLFSIQSSCFSYQGTFSPNPYTGGSPSFPGLTARPTEQVPAPLPVPVTCSAGYTLGADGICYDGSGTPDPSPGTTEGNGAGGGAAGGNAGDGST